MKFFILFAVAFTTALSCFAQDVKGYYITTSGARFDGYFSNGDPADLSKFLFRKNEQAEYVKLPAEYVKEYGTANGLKYIKETVELDETTGITAVISPNKGLNFVKKTIFLETLVESKASLYTYENKGVTTFFYKIDGQVPGYTQLIYKKYRHSETQNGENNSFRQQLTRDMLCTGKNANLYAKLAYGRKSLIEAFRDYNSCSGYESNIAEEAAVSASFFNLYVFAGPSYTSCSFRGLEGNTADADNVGITAGTEFTLAFKYKPYSFFARLGYESFSGDTERTYKPSPSSVHTFTDRFEIKYQLLTFAVGPRYTFEIAKKDRIFIDASLCIGAPLGSDLTFIHTVEGSPATEIDPLYGIKLQTTASFNIGAGYIFNNKFSADIRYNTNRNFLNGKGTDFRLESSGVLATLRYKVL